MPVLTLEAVYPDLDNFRDADHARSELLRLRRMVEARYANASRKKEIAERTKFLGYLDNAIATL
jgi:hypothetical protein